MTEEVTAADGYLRSGGEDFGKVTEKSRKIMWIATGIMTAALLLVMFVTHRAIPFMMDDLWYSTMLSDDTPISSISDIVKSQIWHYNNWGGRSMTHGILQLTLLAGELAADVLNIVFTLLLGWTICLVAEHRGFPALFAGMAMVLGLNANWRMSMFWQAGAANYLYITVFILLFVWCYLRELPDEGSLLPGFGKPTGNGNAPADGGNGKANGNHLPGITLWIIPLGILAGWSNENMGPAVWCLSLLVILLGLREGRKPRLWMLLGNLFCLAGSILCIAAPGNGVRSAQIEEEQYGTLWKVFLRSYGECKGAMEYLFPVLLALLFMLFVSVCVMKRKIGRRNSLLLFCALLSWGAFFLSPHYPDRASFGTMALCICVILSLAGRMVRERQDLAWPLWGGAALIGLRGMYFCGEYLSILWGWIR
ncbi:DUF6056 family protein [Acetatifactor aquisgranensis]|uniref:DUF6056 family protein n=1 Tax=Acetatifactor aquisgranensis TaxID=2941233 RepID=UPI00203BCB9F|nr:DUF6056 family protein [Acetatifactor aquisgranensis]